MSATVSDSSPNLGYWNGTGSTKKFNNPNLLISKLGHLSKNSSILDVGCGYGRSLIELENQNYTNLYGIDYSETMISIAKTKLSGKVTLSVSEARSLGYKSNFFDVVLLFAILNCITKPTEDAKVLKESLRVLRPGGYLLINDFILSESKAKYDIKSDKFGELGFFRVEDKCTMRHTSINRIKNMAFNCKIILEEIIHETSIHGNPVQILSIIFKKPNN